MVWTLPVLLMLIGCANPGTEAASVTPPAAQTDTQAEIAALRQAVVDLHGRLYHQTAQDLRPQLLEAMLRDAVVDVRLLGLDLVRQRLLDLGPEQVAAELRQALRARIDDTDAQVQRGSVLLMRDLADSVAAEMVAQRLAAADNQTPLPLIEAYLLMLARVPQAEAVDPAMTLLNHPTLRAEAAWVLSSAMEVGLVSGDESQQIRSVLRRQLRGNREPHPRVVRLYGQVATDDDWTRIERWLDSEDAALREAAARAWANSTQPLGVLVDRAVDPLIEPIFLAAAARRGQRPATFLAVVDHTPRDAAAAEVWADALPRMAGRMDAAVVLEADGRLADRGVEPSVRLRLLSAAIERFGLPAVSDGRVTGPMPADGQVGRLLLARAALRQAMGDANSARADFQRMAMLWDSLDDAQRLACELGTVQTTLAADELDAALAVMRQSLQRPGQASDPAAPARWTAVADVLLAAVAEKHAADQTDAAIHLLDGLSQSLADARFDGLDQLQQRIADLRRQTSPPDPDVVK